jgi:Xaa-Pro aminopeptidase
MFQTFDSGGEPGAACERIKDVRQLMAAAKIDVLLVPRADEHQGEYVPASADRLKWLTGFSGSAGLAAVAAKAAAVFVDGRYTVQVRGECDPALFEFPGAGRDKLTEWLTAKLPRGGTIGFDPWLHPVAGIVQFEQHLKAKGFKLKPLPRNLVDRVWGAERPAAPLAPVTIQPGRYAGRSNEEKLADVQKVLAEAGQDAMIVTLPDSVAWLFNIRGGDIAHNPVPLAFAIVPAKGKAELFIAAEKLDRDVRAHLSPVTKISAPSTLKDRVAALKAGKKRVRLDAGSAAYWFGRALGGPKGYAAAADPCIALKAIKNKTEIAGARAAHVRDGAALARYLAWLDREAPKGTLDEIEAVTQLETERAKTQALKEISFDTISGAGPNGAIVHYRVSKKTNRKLKPGELFLLDSGAQYLDGTTDVTRTIAIGAPSQEMRDRFTRVLKGHIAIATALFPKGTRGIDLDPFARRALWQAGLDYDHGTGHGVGSYLSVHEGPQSISRAGMVPLEPGMICSNEPGYYKEGAYGIRIENLVLVKKLAKVAGGDREMMAFETLTLVPIDRRLVVPALLTADELAWLNAYHQAVRQVIGPEVDPDTRAWLDAATAELA